MKFDPQKVFAYTYWSKVTRLPDIPENYATIEFVLEAKDNQTILTFTTTNLIAETAYEHSNFYWGITLNVIKKLVES